MGFHSCLQPTFEWVTVDHGLGNSRSYALLATSDSVITAGTMTGNLTIEGPLPETADTRALTQTASDSGLNVDQAIVQLTATGMPRPSASESRTTCSHSSAVNSGCSLTKI